MRRFKVGMVVMVLLALAALAGCGAGGGEDGDESAGRAENAVEPAMAQAGGGGAEAEIDGRAADDAAAAPQDVDADGGVALSVAGGDRIVRDGTMRIEVDDDVDAAFDELTRLADRFGGTVLASDASTGDDGTTSGSVTLRVPAEDYDDLLVAVAGVGEVQRRTITSDDVSDEFVDLEARLRHNQAQERFYLGLIDDAKDVEDAIAVQQRLEGIQQTIEQIRGRLRFLEERTTFSRLTVEVVEAGATFQAGDGQPSLARWLATARAALINVVGALLVVATVALPLAVLGLVVVVALRRYGWPGRRAAAPDA
jgi:hypothetical protein